MRVDKPGENTSGAELRLGRLFDQESGRSFVTAFDHGTNLRVPPKAGKPLEVFEKIVAGKPDGVSIGVIGCGNVEPARKISGFGVRLLVYDPHVGAETISHGAEKVEDMEHGFREGDFVNRHARLTDETRGFIGR